jgi:ankyrin repeat protein
MLNNKNKNGALLLSFSVFAFALIVINIMVFNLQTFAGDATSSKGPVRPKGFTPLMEACLNKDPAKVKELVESGAQINAVDAGHASAFMWAVMGGSLDVVKYLVSINADFRKKGEIDLKKEERTNYYEEGIYCFGNALSVACGMGYYDIAEYLIKDLKVSPNDEQIYIEKSADYLGIVDYTKLTPLHSAAEMGQTAICKLLVEHGAKIDVRMGYNWKDTPFLKAAFNGHLDTCQYLVSAGANISAKDAFGRNALHYAARMGRTDVVNWLLSKGFDVNNKESFNLETPLHEAAQYGHTVTCKLLIDNGADIYAKDKDGDIPFVHAAFEGHEETCRYFIETTYIKTDKKALSDAMLAAEVNCNSETVEMLLNYGADANARRWDTGIALHGACLPITKSLIEHGVDVNSKDKDGYVPLHWADNKEIALALIQAGAIVDIENNDGETPLHNAAKYGGLYGTDTIALLIFYGADVNHKNKHGQTPLHYAAKNGQKEACAFLVKMGADMNAKDHYGKTPAKLAKSFFQREIYIYLKSIETKKPL